jgi:hypothetical protein
MMRLEVVMQLDIFTASAPRLGDINARDARHILAIRSWCILCNANQDPVPRLCEVLGSEKAGQRFALLMQSVAFIWPEPVAVYRYCCAKLTPDETLLAALIQLAVRGCRPRFDEVSRDMLSEDQRNVLFIRARCVYCTG